MATLELLLSRLESAPLISWEELTALLQLAGLRFDLPV